MSEMKINRFVHFRLHFLVNGELIYDHYEPALIKSWESSLHRKVSKVTRL